MNYKNNLSIEKNNFLSLISRGGFISIYGDAEKEINNLYEDLKLAYPLLDLNEVALRFKLSNKKSMRNHCLYIKSICSNLVNEIAEKKDRKQEVNETWQLMG